MAPRSRTAAPPASGAPPCRPYVRLPAPCNTRGQTRCVARNATGLTPGVALLHAERAAHERVDAAEVGVGAARGGGGGGEKWGEVPREGSGGVVPVARLAAGDEPAGPKPSWPESNCVPACMPL